MKLQELRCPNCNGNINISLDKRDTIYCPYCGQQFLLDDGNRETTTTANINKNININKTKRTVNDADIIRAKSDSHILPYSILLMVILLLFMFVPIYVSEQKDKAEEQQALADGKIHAGSYSDYDGQKYNAVVAQLTALGFENIELIDLDDAGLLKNKADTVESVSIGGITNFVNSTYFYPTDKVIISYH
jgi:hypothetical protein